MLYFSVTLHGNHIVSHIDHHGVEGQENMKEALTIAANAHGLPTGSLENHEPLLSHQGCVCADAALPVITLPRQDSGGLENQVIFLDIFRLPSKVNTSTSLIVQGEFFGIFLYKMAVSKRLK